MSTAVSRRQFLILSTALLALSACDSGPPPANFTVKDLFATTPFYIAHRGSGDNWPEHTQSAYHRAVEAGAKALEISVQASSDGVLICHHDLSTLRMTGVGVDIATSTFAELQTLDNNARQWLGPHSNLLPIPRLKEVLDEHAAHRVIFIEDKQGTNTEALLELMESYPNPTEHFIWKQPAPSRRFSVFKEKGYATWGYFAPEDYAKIAQFSGDFDYLGVHHSAPQRIVQELVDTGKPVICWEVHTRSLRDTMAAWGVQGMMCSNFPYVTSGKAKSTHDQFSTGLRAAGDLPSALAWNRQPLLIPGAAAVRLDQKEKSSYSMGSLCPIQPRNYTISFHLAWPDKVPADFEHAGVAFGQESDAAYLVREPSEVSGYHLVLRGSGSLELFSRAAGKVSGKLIRAVKTEPPKAGNWMRFRIQVSDTELRIDRDDGIGWLLTSQDSQFRGGYFSLCRNYDNGPAAQFRSISVSDA
ncbi:glycerophosphodiester phosphodiesterase [Arthrobacter sp. TMN-49]